MKNLSTLILSAFVLIGCTEQPKSEQTKTEQAETKTDTSSSYSAVILEQANTMGQLLLKKDFKPFVKFTYPKIVEMMGGEEKMIGILEKSFTEMESSGTGFLKVAMAEPTPVISVGNELQGTLQQTIEMKLPVGKVVTKSTLIAISGDNGKNWQFVDAGAKDIETIRKILPNVSDKLTIVKQTTSQLAD